MSEINYVILIDSKKSSISPYGQKDAYPIAHGQLGYGERSYSGAGDKQGQTVMDTSYLTPYKNPPSHIDQTVVDELNGYLLQQVTNKMNPDKITVLEITTSDDSASYKIKRKIEHDKALIGSIDNGDAYIITSDKAILSTIPAGGTDATYQTQLDYKNRQINGKG